MIRPARNDDVPGLIAVHERCWRISYAGIADAEAKFTRPVERWVQVWEEMLERTRLAEVHGAVVGFVCLGPSRDEDASPRAGEIYALYVDPDHQRAGHGRALVEAALEELRDAGFARVTLWTFEHNPPSRRFYERLGFAWDGATTNVGDGRIVRYARGL